MVIDGDDIEIDYSDDLVTWWLLMMQWAWRLCGSNWPNCIDEAVMIVIVSAINWKIDDRSSDMTDGISEPIDPLTDDQWLPKRWCDIMMMSINESVMKNGGVCVSVMAWHGVLMMTMCVAANGGVVA